MNLKTQFFSVLKLGLVPGLIALICHCLWSKSFCGERSIACWFFIFEKKVQALCIWKDLICVLEVIKNVCRQGECSLHFVDVFFLLWTTAVTAKAVLYINVGFWNIVFYDENHSFCESFVWETISLLLCRVIHTIIYFVHRWMVFFSLSLLCRPSYGDPFYRAPLCPRGRESQLHLPGNCQPSYHGLQVWMKASNHYLTLKK